MSWVTYTMLHFGCMGQDEEVRALERVNAFFTEGPGYDS